MTSFTKTLLASAFTFLIVNSAFSTSTTPHPVAPPQISQVPEENPENLPLFALTHNWLRESAVEGRDIGLGDGSNWRVEPSYRSEAASWIPGDPLLLSPNYMPFSSNLYWLKNLRTKTYILVDVIREPYDRGEHSHFVSTHSEDGAIIYLENRVGFEIDRRDRWLSQEWLYEDHIVIGASNAWFGTYEFILYNVNLNHYVRAKLHK
ncbi:MAG: hypothetical protein HYX48_05220 [Chlamydiales bacterium]|nr:hypothetical protein [Chlamydiales bacterium]